MTPHEVKRNEVARFNIMQAHVEEVIFLYLILSIGSRSIKRDATRIANTVSMLT
jgi:hypothetical protein